MKYYDEQKMVDIEKVFEKNVLNLERSNFQTNDGLLCYLYNRKFIGFLVTNGIVVMKLSEKDQTLVRKKFGGKPFEMGGQKGKLWVTPLKGPKDLQSIMPFVRRRYEEVSSTYSKV